MKLALILALSLVAFSAEPYKSAMFCTSSTKNMATYCRCLFEAPHFNHFCKAGPLPDCCLTADGKHKNIRVCGCCGVKISIDERGTYKHEIEYEID